MTTEEQLKHFADLVETSTLARLRAEGYTYTGIDNTAKVTVKPGTKYIKVDVGESGKYMIEAATGDIYGIKAYGVIHRGHKYGNIASVDLWNWGGYHATPKIIPGTVDTMLNGSKAPPAAVAMTTPQRATHTPNQQVGHVLQDWVEIWGPDDAEGTHEVLGSAIGPERKANAPLWAAAPELLELCLRTKPYLASLPGKYGRESRDLLECIKAVIARATGEGA
jgi:hypothetical protein